MSRVRLRPPTARDRDEFLALVRASRRLHRGWVVPPRTPAQYRAALRRWGRETHRAFLVCRRDDGAIVGVVIVSEIVRGAFQSAYLSYYGGAPFAGNGYMTEAVALLLRHAFTALGLHRMEANIQPANARSIALVERCGFRREGFSRRYLKVCGRWRDHERWAILREGWRARAAPRARPCRPGPRSRQSIRSRRRRAASTAGPASLPSASRRSTPRS